MVNNPLRPCSLLVGLLCALASAVDHPAGAPASVLVESPQAVLEFSHAGSGARLGVTAGGELAVTAPGGVFVDGVNLLGEMEARNAAPFAVNGALLPPPGAAHVLVGSSILWSADGLQLELAAFNNAGQTALSLRGLLSVEGLDILTTLRDVGAQLTASGPAHPSNGEGVQLDHANAAIKFGAAAGAPELARAGDGVLSSSVPLAIDGVDVFTALQQVLPPPTPAPTPVPTVYSLPPSTPAPTPVPTVYSLPVFAQDTLPVSTGFEPGQKTVFTSSSNADFTTTAPYAGQYAFHLNGGAATMGLWPAGSQPSTIVYHVKIAPGQTGESLTYGGGFGSGGSSSNNIFFRHVGHEDKIILLQPAAGPSDELHFPAGLTRTQWVRITIYSIDWVSGENYRVRITNPSTGASVTGGPYRMRADHVLQAPQYLTTIGISSYGLQMYIDEISIS